MCVALNPEEDVIKSAPLGQLAGPSSITAEVLS
jgi:hypothetical protein